MSYHRVFKMLFAKVYPLLLDKVERKDRTKEELDEIICWLTGYDPAGLQRLCRRGQNQDLSGVWCRPRSGWSSQARAAGSGSGIAKQTNNHSE